MSGFWSKLLKSSNKKKQCNAKLSTAVKLVVVGDGCVGKSALTIQYLQKIFLTQYDPTIEDSYVQTTIIDGKCYTLDILDTAGQKELSAMRELYMRRGDGFLLVYSVTNRESFNLIEDYHKSILRIKDRENSSFPMLLVANKVDQMGERQVELSEGVELARRLGIDYIETSCKDPPLHVDKAFHDIVRIIQRDMPIQQKPVKKSSTLCTIL